MARTKDLTIVTGNSLPSTAVDSERARQFQEAKARGVRVEDFIQDFLGDFLSEDTKRAYQNDLDDFFTFVAEGGDRLTHPRDIFAYHFQLYRDHLIQTGKASATVNRKLVAIRSFMKWALATKMIDHNPLQAVKLPRVQTESPTQAFDDAEVTRMLEAPDLQTEKGPLHRMALVLLFHMGLRRAELGKVRVGDFLHDRGHFVLRVLGKGDKVRLIPVNEFVRQEIQQYLRRLKERGVALEALDYLLQADPKRRRGEPLDGSTIYRLVNKYARALGIPKKVSPHSCRATVISHLLDTQLAPIRDVAIFAGHANVTTTERYDKRRQNLDNSAAYQVDFHATKKDKVS